MFEHYWWRKYEEIDSIRKDVLATQPTVNCYLHSTVSAKLYPQLHYTGCLATPWTCDVGLFLGSRRTYSTVRAWV